MSNRSNFASNQSGAPSPESLGFRCVQNGSSARREEGAYLDRYVTDEQRSSRPIFNATLRAAASWLFFRVARSTVMTQIAALRSRLEKQPTDLRRNPRDLGDGALAPPHRPARSVAWIIAASSVAFAVIQLDVTIVNVALFRISTDFGATVADLQWVVDAYTLGFAALLLSAGVVADRWGSKRVFVAGFVGFAAASLACGLAPGPGFLNATRAIQGIGAALLVPSSLAILNDACARNSRLRARAIGIWTAAGGVAIAAGPVVGGLLLTGLGWRSIFLVNIPICAFGIALALRWVPPTQPNREKRRSFDLPGQALAIVALTAFIGAIIEARPLGITHPMVAAGSLLALAAGAAFIAVETRTASPMLPLHFFRLPGFTPAVVFGVLANCTYYGIIFVLSLYLQKAMGYSTVQAGLAFIPLTGTFIVSNIASGWMAGRTG